MKYHPSQLNKLLAHCFNPQLAWVHSGKRGCNQNQTLSFTIRSLFKFDCWVLGPNTGDISLITKLVLLTLPMMLLITFDIAFIRSFTTTYLAKSTHTWRRTSSDGRLHRSPSWPCCYRKNQLLYELPNSRMRTQYNTDVQCLWSHLNRRNCEFAQSPL